MIDEKIYRDYAEWLLKHESLLKKINASSVLSLKFKHVSDVVDFLYNELIDNTDYSEDQDLIFKTGVYYLAEMVEYLEVILINVYKNNFVELEKQAKSINFYLSIKEFIFETEAVTKKEDEDFNAVLNLYNDVENNYITKKQAVPVSLFSKFDNFCAIAVNKLDYEYKPINNIFLEIAEEFKLI